MSNTLDDFKDKVVLVTGAGSGIGREAAKQFSARGALVYCGDLNDQGLAETQEMITKAGGKARTAHVDVSSEKEVSALLDRIGKEAGRLDAAFNNAGITGGAFPLEDYPASDFEKVLRINLMSVFLCMKFELPLIKRGGRGGAICNTASIAAISGPGGMAGYSASKHGVVGLTRVAAMENASHNIRVNGLLPGLTATPMAAHAAAQNPSFAKHNDPAGIPAKRSGQPSELAAAAVWLCSSEASYVFGQMLVVDGGITTGGWGLE